MPLLSIIIPVYNEEESIEHVISALRETLSPEDIQFEIVFICDGSLDATFEQVVKQSDLADNIRGYRFSRNFGKEAAIWAGLQNSSGDCCVVMDGDLQHPPKALPKMLAKWQEGYKVVEGIKASRGQESALYRFFSRTFYRVMSALSGFDMRSSSDFKLLDRQVVQELLKLDERNTFFRGLSFWMGFPSTEVQYEVAPREYGKSNWNFFKLFRYALNNVIGFSTAPLQFVTGIGAILVVASIALAIHTLVRFFIGESLEGFTTVILILLFIGGSTMVSLGIIGLYVAKIYEEVKGRPRFIISESVSREAVKSQQDYDLKE